MKMIMPGDLPIGGCLFALRKKLSDSGIETADLDARLLVQAATGIDHAGMIMAPERLLSSGEIVAIEEMLQRRLRREPVSRILGVREFYGREFSVTGDVLDPRPDTETLVNLALRVAADRTSCDILDIGTGTGAIIITLLCELAQAKGVASDISKAALKVARANSCRHGVEKRLELVETVWCAGIEQRFDIIVSNPPYIASETIDQLDRDVRDYDPHLALDGGRDGLDAYRQLALQCPARMKPGAVILLEIGFDQADKVAGLFQTQGFVAHSKIEVINKDIAGNDRVVTMVWP